VVFLSIERYVRHAEIFDQEKLLQKKIALQGSGHGPEFMQYCLAGLGVGGVANNCYNITNPHELNPRIKRLKEDDCNETLVLNESDPVVAGIDAAMLVVESCSGKKPFKKVSLASDTLDKKIAVIGAGGIGTYAALFGGLCGATLDVYDYDTVEASNLNRQVFYGNHILEKKSFSMKEEHHFIREAYDMKITEETVESLKEYDLVFSCVDNAETRVLLDSYCHDNIPLIDGGTSAKTGRVNYCGRPLGEQITLKKKQRARCMEADSSVVMPNMIVAAAMVSHACSQDEKSIHYDMRENILYEGRND